MAASTPDASRVRSGLNVDLLDDLLCQLDLSQEAFDDPTGMSECTLLAPAESDHVWRLLHIWNRALAALGSTSAARAWLIESKDALGGESPVERLDTEPGLREVEDILTFIDETGVA